MLALFLLSLQKFSIRTSSRSRVKSNMSFAKTLLIGTWLMLCMLCTVTEGSALVDVYRLLQYDIDGENFGSRRVALNQHASLVGLTGGRSVVVVPFAEIDVAVVSELLQSNSNNIAGLLFVLPQDFEGVGAAATAELQQLERLLLESKVVFPVYFAVENDDLTEMIAGLEPARKSGIPPSASTGGYKLVVSTREPKPMPTPALENYQTWLHAATPQEGVEEARAPLIAVVAHYDTLGVAPGLAVGADSNGSGVSTLLGLLRLFSGLYKDTKTQGSYNMVFVLTAGGPLNFAGSEHWLDTVDVRLLETLEFVLCIDSVGASAAEADDADEGLFLHISRPPKEDSIKQLYSEFESVADQQGVPFTIKHKKVNISSPMVAWEHEQYAKRKIVAGTLSARRQPSFHPAFSHLHDSKPHATTANLARAVNLAGEALVRYMYGHSGRDLNMVDAAGPDSGPTPTDAFTQQWAQVLSNQSRAVPHHVVASFTQAPPSSSSRASVSKPFTSASASLSPLSSSASATPQVHLAGALRAAFAEFGSQCSAQPFRLNHQDDMGRYTFYDSASAKLEIYKVASIMFDIYAFGAVAVYLVLLWLVLGVSTRGLQETMQAFQRHPVRKQKSI